jgi:putative Mn2+ efflux pump MntP
MSKAVIAPIVAVLAMVLGGIFDVEIGEDTQAQITEFIGYVVLGGVGVYGIIKDFRKKKEQK